MAILRRLRMPYTTVRGNALELLIPESRPTASLLFVQSGPQPKRQISIYFYDRIEESHTCIILSAAPAAPGQRLKP